MVGELKNLRPNRFIERIRRWCLFLLLLSDVEAS
jgi:hypothetical protein